MFLIRIHYLSYKLRFLFVGVLSAIACCAVIWLAAAAFGPAAGSGQTADDIAAMQMSDSSNAVTHFMSVAAFNLQRSVGSVAKSAQNELRSAGSAVARAGGGTMRGIQRGALATAHGIGAAITLAATSHGRGILFVVRIPASIFGFMSRAPVVNAVIQPEPVDHNQVPIIDPQAPEVQTAKLAVAAAEAAPQTPQTIWPIHGAITTLFGVPELPYQAVHTGLDISDGKPAGTTPIKAFHNGKVITAERSGGLGNHVVIDHGSGVTSVYGHLAVISVQVGQAVTTDTTVGYEGSTGVSTGPHLHFEIRVNGQATDPHQFITGQP